MTGFDSVSRAADIAAASSRPLERRDTPSDPRWEEPCEELVREVESFYDDPITEFYGVGSEMAPLVTRLHVERHKCQGWGRL